MFNDTMRLNIINLGFFCNWELSGVLIENKLMITTVCVKGSGFLFFFLRWLIVRITSTDNNRGALCLNTPDLIIFDKKKKKTGYSDGAWSLRVYLYHSC